MWDYDKLFAEGNDDVLIWCNHDYQAYLNSKHK